MTNETNQPIVHIHKIELDFNGETNHRIEITNLINKDIRIGIFNIDKNDDLSNNLEKSDDGMIVDEAEIGNGSPAIINNDDILKLKLGRDRHNVGHKQSHVMMLICLLNEGEKVLKLEHQYCICLYVRCEKYGDLAKIEESTGGKWNWTSLMDPDKKKVLKYFPVSQFIPGIRGQEIEKLWREFF
ncbi:hypothetical protein C1645_823240 [Glomus cerebriforme]|uniref:Uncharacterized protein n=1 Tax=Glomus cerebriforme TaxID=658196 RepID=A0A397SWF5_9GLOM|nr:hypothetical protein C1645_823240 [Glomus cerebriforme]